MQVASKVKNLHKFLMRQYHYNSLYVIYICLALQMILLKRYSMYIAKSVWAMQ